MSIAVFADLHLHEHSAFATEREGHNSRLMDGRDAVLAIASKSVAYGVRRLLCAGDWHHSRRKISVPVLDVGAATIRAVREDYGMEVDALEGNHDLSMDGGSCSLDGLPFLNVYDKPGVVEIDGFKIGMIPWTDDPKVVAEALRAKADFFVGHLGLEGGKVGPSDVELPGHIPTKVLRNVEVPVLLGHYHKPQDVKGTTAMYVGSPVQLSWGERGEDKRFVVVSRKNGEAVVESVPLPDFPRFVRITESELETVRPQDFVEVVVRKAKHVRRVRRKIELTRGEGGANIVVSEEGDAAAPRIDLAGLKVADQIRRFVKHAGVPAGVTEDELVHAGLSLIEGAE